MNTMSVRNWKFEIMIILELILLVGLGILITDSVRYGIILGCILYFLLSSITRKLFLSHHQKGIRLMRAEQFSEAALEFHMSCQYFTKHQNIDRFRFITMFQSSKLSYKHMGMYNLLVCHLRQEQFDLAEKLLHDLLDDSPPEELTPALEEIKKALEMVKNAPEEKKNSEE